MIILAEDSKSSTNTEAKIKVVGVGGCGCNAINCLIKKGISGVELIGINTDLQSLNNCKAPVKIQAGKSLTRGLGAGARPETGQKAVEEVKDEIEKFLKGSDLVFIAAGMGKGTGTGGAPVVAEIAKSLNALVIGIVYTPFNYEGNIRMKIAEEGLKNLREKADTLIVISNQKLLSLAGSLDILSAIEYGNEVLYNAVRGVTDIITKHGIINVDFNDLRSIMQDMGDALLGTGIARGEHRASEATQKAISNPLVEGLSITGAKGVLINIVGNKIKWEEVEEAVRIIREKTGDEVNLIQGVVLDESMNDEIMVTVIATGLSASAHPMKRVPPPSSSQKRVVPVYERNEEYPENINIPAYIRRGIILNVKSGEPHSTKDKKDYEDDNPTFLKQVMD